MIAFRIGSAGESGTNDAAMFQWSNKIRKETVAICLKPAFCTPRMDATLRSLASMMKSLTPWARAASAGALSGGELASPSKALSKGVRCQICITLINAR